MNRKLISLSAASALAFGLAACTSAQLQGVVAAIDAACIGLPVAASLVIDVASSITGAHTVITVANAVQADATKVCSDALAGVQNVISNINAAGGTATVTVSTNAKASSLHRLAHAVQAAYPQAHVKIGANVITFVVPPSPFF